MKILIDTNVILDVLVKRKPYAGESVSFLKLCGHQITGCIATSQTTDIFYLLRRYGKDSDEAKDVIKKLSKNIKVLDVTAADVDNALASLMPDYEDALLACLAKRQKAKYIVTRNEKDFRQSPVQAVSPSLFLSNNNFLV